MADGAHREGDAAPPLLLADALLRQGTANWRCRPSARAPAGRRTTPSSGASSSRRCWPAIRRRTQALDELVQAAEDEPSLALALLVLYEAFVTAADRGVEQDRARMTRLADAYRTRGGPSLALVETWVAAAAPK